MRVGLFVTCLVDQLFPRVGARTLQLLRLVGMEVVVDPRGICCGQPAFNTGFPAEARRVGRGLLDCWEDCDAVVAPSGSCVAMVRHHLSGLFEDDPALKDTARSLAERTWELSDFLVNRLGITDVGARFPHVVTYHDSCHTLRELRIEKEPRLLLQEVRDLELVEMNDGNACCGFGGTFAVKFPDISSAIGNEKVRSIKATGAQFVVGGDVSCLMHIGGLLQRAALPIRPLHLAEVLTESP